MEEGEDEENQGAILRNPYGSWGFFIFMEIAGDGNSVMSRSKKKIGVVLSALLLTVYCLLFTVSFAAEPPERIISLAPNITEILFALGLGDRIVGVTTFCDFPAEARQKPKVGGMSNPSLEAVVSLRPDIVVMTTDGNPKEFEERLRGLGIRTYVSRERRLSELPHLIGNMGTALGSNDKAEHLARETRHTLDSFSRQKPPSRRAFDAEKKRVLFIVWPEPLIVAGPGTVIDDAIALLGFTNMAAGTRSSYPKYSIEEILRRPPDFIVIGRGMNREDIEKVSEGLLGKLRTLPVVKSGRVFFVSDDLYRLGPRTVSGIAELAGVLGLP